MAKGILIDVGFKADVNGFVEDIKKDFKKINFDDAIGLSEAFKKQEEEVRKQLKDLSKVIDETINGKLPNDPSKQLQALNKAVSVLSSSMKNMIESMPDSETAKFADDLGNITSIMNQLVSVCDNATNSVDSLHKSTNSKLNFVDSKQLKILEDLYKLLERAREQTQNFDRDTKQHGNKPYEDEEDALTDIIALNKIYINQRKELKKAKEILAENPESIENIQNLDKIYASLAETITRLNRTMNTYASFNSKGIEKAFEKLIPNGKSEISLGELSEKLQENLEKVLNKIAEAKARIQSEYSQLGGGDLQELFLKGMSKNDESNSIRIPISISATPKGLSNKVIKVINAAQAYVNNTPLQVEVQLVSPYKSKRNQAIFEQILEGLDKVKDKKVKSEILSLVEGFDNALIFNVNINTQKATMAVKEFVQNARDELALLSSELAPLEPELILTEEHKEAFQKQIDAIKNGFTINVGIMDGDETVDEKSTKKELRYIHFLKTKLEEVEKAVEVKTAAFVKEETVVKDVIVNETDYLNSMYSQLLLIEDALTDISVGFSLLPKKYEIDIDFKSLDSLKNILDNNVFNRIDEAKEVIYKALSQTSENIIEIPEDKKQELYNDIKNMASELNSLFETKGIEVWSSKFIQALDTISNKFKTLFGENALNDIIKDWKFSDELMLEKNGFDHLRERAAVLASDGKVYGYGTYDSKNSTRFRSDINNELKNKGLSPIIGIHSHGADRIAASSIPQISTDKDGRKTVSNGDLIVRYNDFIKDGIEKQLTVALNDIELFDAKGFFESNKKIDFSSNNIKNKIAKKSEEIHSSFMNNFYQYFDKFVSEYGTKDGLELNAIFDIDKLKNNNNAKAMDLLKSRINPQELLDEFFKQTKTGKKSIGDVYSNALVNVIKNNFPDIQEISNLLGIDKKQVNNILNKLYLSSKNEAKEIVDNAFNIGQYKYSILGSRDLLTYSYRQLTPQILSESLKGLGYNNDYQDFIKSYHIDEFIKENPLGLPSNSLSDMFNISTPATLLETLDKIAEKLKEITDFASNDKFKDIFNIKLDESSLKEVDRLIELINKISNLTNISFDNLIPTISEDDNKSDKISKSFKNEKTIVDLVIDNEIESLNELAKAVDKVTESVESKTKAFEKEGNIVDKVVNGEIDNLDPLQSLEFNYNNFKKFYDNNDLESEAGVKAALSYYKSYKDALISKVNKKDLKQYTIGNIDDLFSGNYTNYKKGIGELDLSGLINEIDKYQTILDELNKPEIVSVIEILSQSIKNLMDAGNNSEKTTEFLTSLNKIINNLSGNKSAEKIQKIADNLTNFKNTLDALDTKDSGVINTLSSILEKGEELKALGEVLKSTNKKINEAQKALNAQNNIDKSSKYLEEHEGDIYDSLNKRFGSDNIITSSLSATKEGLVQVIALIKDADNKYQKYTLSVKENGELQKVSAREATIKEIQNAEIYERMRKLAVPGAKNLGNEAVTFTPDSHNWDLLVDKAKDFGIELKDIQKIVRNVDRVGHESFQIFTKLSRITVGMDSNGVLFQYDDVLDKNVIDKFKKEIGSLSSLLSNSFYSNNGTAFNLFIDSLNDVKDKWIEINNLSKKGLIDNSELSSVLDYINSFKNGIIGLSLEKIANLDKKTPEFLEQYKIAEDYLNNLYIIFDKIETDMPFTDDDINQIKLFSQQMANLFNLVNKNESKLANSVSISKLLGKIYDTLDKNSSMSKDYRDKFEGLAKEIKSFGDNIPIDKLKEFDSQFFKLISKIKEAGQTGKSFLDLIISRARGMSASLIAQYFSLYDIIRYLKEGISTIKEIDSAMTELKKVSSATIGQIEKSLPDMIESAKEFGSSVTDMISATSDWSRMGYGLPDSKQLAEVALLYKNVGDGIDIQTANQSLISTLQGFKLEAKDAMDIIDKFNEVANTEAIDTAGIGEALQRSASSFYAANNTLSESIALITATNSVVQDPSSVGNVWKTVTMRIRGAKAELEEAGEDTEGMVESTSKLRDLIKGMTGFDIMLDENTFKSTYEIIKGISKEWKNLSDIEQASLLEALAGKRGGNALSAVLNNTETLERAYNTAENASGSAMKEQERYEQSIEYSWQRLSATIEEFWTTLIDSSVVKNVIDFLNKALEIVTKIVDTIGTVPTLISAGFGLYKFKNVIDDSMKKHFGLNPSGDDSEDINTEATDRNTDSKTRNAQASMAEASSDKASTEAKVENTTATKIQSEALNDYDTWLKTGMITQEDYNALLLKSNAEKEASILVNGQKISTETKELLIKGDLITAEELEAGITIEVTKAKIADAVASEKITKAEGNQLISTLNLNKGLGTLRGGFEKLATTIESHPILTTITLIIGSILALKTAYEKVSYEGKMKEFNEFKEETQKAVTELEDYTNRLNEIGDKIDEINNKDTISISDKEDLERLEKERNELDLIVKKYKEKADIAKKNEEEEALKLVRSSVSFSNVDLYNENGLKTDKGFKIFYSVEDYYDALMQSFIKIQKKLSDEDLSDEDKTYYEKLREDTIEEITEQSSRLSEVAESVSGVTEAGKVYLENLKARDLDYEMMLFAADKISFDDLSNDSKKKAYLSRQANNLGIGDKSIVTSMFADKNEILSYLKSISDEDLAILYKNGFEVTAKTTVNEIKKALDEAVKKVSTDYAANEVNSVKDLLTSSEDKTKPATLMDLQEEADLLKSINEQISETGRISTSTLKDISEKYPEMSQYLFDYMTGQITQTELFEKLEECYNQDVKSYKSTLMAKYDTDTSYYEHLEEMYPEVFENLTELYEEDAKNWNSIANAKKKTDAKLIDALSDGWSKYYSVVYDAQSGLMSLMGTTIDDTDGGSYDKDRENISEQASAKQAELQRIIDAFNELRKASDENIDLNLPDLSWGTLSGLDSDSKNASEEIVDWIETLISRIEREITNLGNVVDDTYDTWINRNSALSKELSKVSDEISIQQDAYNAYMSAANSVGLSGYYEERVRNGALDIETITNEELKDQISKYKEYYEKALEAEDKVVELRRQLNELNASKLDNIVSQFEDVQNSMSHVITMLEKTNTIQETSGYFSSASILVDILEQTQKQLDSYRQERTALLTEFNDLVGKGVLIEGTSAFYEAKSKIDNVNESILDTVNSVKELQNQIQELDWSKFEYLETLISDLISESDFYIDLMEKIGNLVNKEDGSLTDFGNTTIALHRQNYETYLSQADDYANEIKKINEELANDPASKTLIDKKRELIEAQRQSILSARDEKDAIKSVIEEAYNAQIEALSKLISKYKDLMSDMSDMYDYQKTMKDQSKAVLDIQKQLNAYSGDNSEETKATVRKLQIDLTKAEEELQQSQYDKMKSDTEKLLDDLQQEYEDYLNGRLDNIESEMMDILQELTDSTNIVDTLNKLSEDSKLALSDEINNIWNTDNPVTSMDTVVKDIREQNTGVRSALDGISDKFSKLLRLMEKEADDNISDTDIGGTSSGSSDSDSSSGSSGSNSTPSYDYSSTPSSSSSSSSRYGGDGYPEVGDRVIFDNGWYHSNSYGGATGAYYQGEEVYITGVNPGSPYPYHISTGDEMGYGDLGWLELEQLRGYKVGAKHIDKSQYAWTNENGSELIRTRDGALLTRLNPGDSVFTAGMSDILWDFAKNPSAFLSEMMNTSGNISKYKTTNNTSMNVSYGNVTLNFPEVKNYDDFMKKAQSDKRFENMVKELTLGQTLGNNSFRKKQF